MEDKKVLLSIRDLNVKFRVRGRVLTAIRDISLDIYENETIAIVGESGCGKSVFTKTFAGTLDNNGYIEHGDIIFNDSTLDDLTFSLNGASKRFIDREAARLDRYTQAAGTLSAADKERNKKLAKEIYMSVSRYDVSKRPFLVWKLRKAFRDAIANGQNLDDEKTLRDVFETAVFRVSYKGETENELHGSSYLNMARVNCIDDWTEIRGNKIATIFQDPMTSLNPILTIGSQISSVIMRHQHVSDTEARKRAIELMRKVGIPDPEIRYDDYPFQYSGGMRQRIVIAILICDEPTTALDVTIQAQILKLIKDLQKEFNYTMVFITHDLGVVANVADRVAVLYAGQIIELGSAEEVFYDPRHPYTWALLSSLPQLCENGSELYSIAGTPPSLYNVINGDAFAPRNPYCLKLDTIKEPPMFKVTDTHYARTWLLDPRAPQVEKPEIIQDINGTLRRVFNI